MFELLGDKPDSAAAGSQTVMRIETALAKGSMTRVERRDPKALDHKLTSGDLEKLSPDFGWHTYFAKVGIPSLDSLNVAVPNYFKTMNEEIAKENLDDWKTYLRWHLVHAECTFPVVRVPERKFRFYGKTLRGQEELQARWKRCTDRCGRRPGRSAGPGISWRSTFGPQSKQQALKMVNEIEAAMAARH